MVGRRVVAIVPPDAAGTRLDRFLAGLPGVGTRSQVKRWVDQGLVRVDGQPRKAALVLEAGARVEVEVPLAQPTTAEPEAIALDVLYEDADLLAINKPPGLVVHPAPGSRRGTLVNALLYRLGPLAGVGDPDRPGIVHRLDRDTSGILLVARSPAALEGLARQFRERTIEKQYLALVRGRPATDRGTIDQPIGRHPIERKRMSVHSHRGRAARTHWEVLERFRDAAWLRIGLETGRTHQIRVHLAAAGHPVVGDRVYGGASGGRDVLGSPLGACPRQALHAASIRFAHPRTGEPMALEAPLAEDLRPVLEALRRGSA